MTPKEKASELINKLYSIMMNDQPPGSKEYAAMLDLAGFAKFISEKTFHIMNQAKECSLLHVDEILKEIPMYTGNLNPRWKFWNDVKDELNKM